MVERSRFWDGTVLGDATVAPYDAATEFSEVMLALAGDYPDTNKGGVLGLLSLAVTSPSANTARVAAGQAIVWGTWYENTANLDFTIPTPAGSTRIDRIVLRKSWAAQTVRLVRIAGAEGGSAPAMVQTAGTTWDIPIVTVSITTGGVMTFTDVRTQNTLWYRTAATTIRTDSNVGIGKTVEPLWDAGYRVVQIGNAGVLMALDGGNGVYLRQNSYVSGGVNKSMQNEGSTQLNMEAGTFIIYNAPAVASGSTQTMAIRLWMSQAGCFAINASAPDNLSSFVIGQPGAELAVTNASVTGLNVSQAIGRAGGTGGNIIGTNINCIARNNGTTTGLVAGLSVALSGTNPGTTTEIATLYVYTPSVSGGTVTAGTYVIKHGNTIACLTTGGVWTSVSHEFADDGSRWKTPVALIDPDTALAQIRQIPIRKYTYAQDADTSEHAGMFSEELHRINPMMAYKGKGVDPISLLAFAFAGMQAMADRIEALEGKVN